MSQNTNTAFLDALLKNILDGRMIPKYQVERAISPLLGIFLPDILTEKLKSKNKIEMICAEFPLKKPENNQSTNIDWLMYDEDRDELIFFEMKTSDSSYKQEQFDIYDSIINKSSFSFLINGLEDIWGVSLEHGKYSKIIEDTKKFKDKITNCKNARIVYLVPKIIKVKLIRDFGQEHNVTVLSFSDLPETLPLSEFASEWKVIRKAIQEINNSSVALRNGKNGQTQTRINFEEKVDFNQIIELCKTSGKPIVVGYVGGLDNLMKKSIAEIEKRKWKWDVKENGQGVKTPSNWIDGDKFLQAIENIRQIAL
jgi:hypothetical protein